MTLQEQVEQAHLIGAEAVAGKTGSSGSRLCPPCSTAPPSYWPGPAYLAALSRNHNPVRPPFKSKISAQSKGRFQRNDLTLEAAAGPGARRNQLTPASRRPRLAPNSEALRRQGRPASRSTGARGSHGAGAPAV